MMKNLKRVFSKLCERAKPLPTLSVSLFVGMFENCDKTVGKVIP